MKSKCHTPEHNLSAEPDSLPVYLASLVALYIRAHHGPAGSTATITAWLCSTHATWASSSVVPGSWGKVSPARNTGSSSAHTAGQSAAS